VSVRTNTSLRRKTCIDVVCNSVAPCGSATGQTQSEADRALFELAKKIKIDPNGQAAIISTAIENPMAKSMCLFGIWISRPSDERISNQQRERQRPHLMVGGRDTNAPTLRR
jgi:hypothetical protein